MMVNKSRFYQVLIFSCIFCRPVFPQQVFLENGEPTYRGHDGGTFIDTPKRTKIDLAGQWKYSLDDENWESVLVPSAFPFVGRVTFMRSFSVPDIVIGNSGYTFVCYGVNYNSEFYINGIFVGRHVGGSTSFTFEIPENLIQIGKENVVKIVVDNELDAKTTLPLRQQVWGWKNYGGITKDIFILVTPHIWTENIVLRQTIAENLQSASLTIHGTINNNYEEPKDDAQDVLTSSEYNVRVEIIDRQTNAIIANAQSPTFQLQYKKITPFELTLSDIHPKLWSPLSPDLYLVRLVILKDGSVLDEYDENIGFRKVNISDGHFILNGEQFAMKGIVWREDHPRFGNALTYGVIEKDIALIKSLGVNVIRVASGIPHPYIVNLCDRYGLFLMEEIPAWNIPGEILARESMQEIARTTLQEMIVRDRNHPSVLAWGLGDDFDSADPRAIQFVRSLHNVAADLDNRFTYYATQLLNNDQCASTVDFVGLNSNESNVKEFSAAVKGWKNAHPDQPVFIAKYGKEVEPDNHNGYTDPMSYETQARYIQFFYKAIQDADILGSTLWSFSDWRGDRPLMTTDEPDRYICTTGLVTVNRDKRTSFEVLKALFNDEKVAALPMGNHSISSPLMYVIFGMSLFLLFMYVFNSNRRFRDNIMRSLFRPYNFFADVRDQRFLSPIHSISLAAFLAVALAIILSSVLFYFRSSKLLDYVVTHFIQSNTIKDYFGVLVWSPWKSILVYSGFFLLLAGLIILIVYGIQLFSRTKIFFYHAYSITIWSMLPYVILIPVGMVLYRILEYEAYIIPTFIFLLVINIWVFFRLFRSISIIYDKPPIRVYIIGILLVVAVISMVVMYYDYTQSTLAYYRFFKDILNNMR